MILYRKIFTLPIINFILEEKKRILETPPAFIILFCLRGIYEKRSDKHSKLG
jgi:hypothetical protein